MRLLKIKLEEKWSKKEFGKRIGSWTGTVNKEMYVIDKVRTWIEENNRPTKIEGEKKNFICSV